MEKINKLHVGEKLYIPCKKNYVVLVHRIYTSYRVALYHRSDILGYSFFIKSFGLKNIREAKEIVKEYLC